MPHGYGYGNARLRAMRSKLLTPADYDALLTKTSVEDLIAALSKTPYQAHIEAALLRVGKDRCVIEAVRLNLAHTLDKIRHFFEGEPRELLDLLLRKWDRHNVLAILRGQSHELSAGQMMAAVVPAGQFDEAALQELARQPGLRAAIDLMTTWSLPYAGPLREAQARLGAIPRLDQLELALNQFHYHTLLRALGGGDANHRLLREHVQTEIDLVNLRTLLRLSRLPGVDVLVKQRYQSTDMRPLFVEPGGFLAVPQLMELTTGGGVENVIRSLHDSRYGPALQAGFERYQGNLTALERELERWQAAESVAMFSRNPLSMAIPLGFLGCKEVEAANVRLIAQAVALDLKRDSIKQELI